MKKWAVIEIEKSTGKENQIGLFENEKDAKEFADFRNNDIWWKTGYRAIIRCGLY